MTMTVENMLKLPSTTNLSVAAGEAGLWHEISTVNVMEVPDISKYLKRGELLITTMYAIRDNENLQRQLIPLLSEKGVAALVLVPLYEHSNVPEFMLEQANTLGLPLITAPYGIAFNDIMTPILHGIIRTCQRSELIGGILQGRIISLSQALAMGQSFNCNLEGAFIPVCANGSINIKLPSDVIVASIDSDVLLLFPLSHIKNTKKRANEVLKLFETCRAMHIGVGRAIDTIMELPQGFAQAELAMALSKKAKLPQHIVCYDNLGIYRVLLSTNEAEKHFFAKEMLESIIEEPMLIETLRAYFNNMGNYRSIAKSLFVHHNTVANRLAKVEQLTGLRLDNPEDCLSLQIAIMLFDLNPA